MAFSRRKSESAPAPLTGKQPAKPARAPSAFGNQATLRAVRDGFASPAHPISPSVRTSLDRRIGEDTSPVRLHSGPEAERAADALQARAVTAGRDIVMGRGVRPSASDPTLLHEAIHAKQQGFAEVSDPATLPLLPANSPFELAAAGGDPHGAGSSAPMLARDAVAPAGPATTPATQPAAPIIPPLTPDFPEVFRRFDNLMLDPAERRRLALDCLRLMHSSEHARLGGEKLMQYFFSQGMNTEGEEVMRNVVNSWTIEHVALGGTVPEPNFLGYGVPKTMVDAGRAAARADNHELAFRLLGNAYMLLSFQAEAAIERRAEETEGAAPEVVAFTRSHMFGLYSTMQQVYADMRGILRLYHDLAAEARAAGDTQRAAYLGGLALMLYKEIREDYVWAEDPQILAEVELAEPRPGRFALRLHGVNSESTDLTQLPGLDPPREAVAGGEVGAVTSQWQAAGAVTDTLHRQVELMVELQGHPEIQREFGNTEIDLQNLDHRLRVWRTMLGVYRAQSVLGGNGLSSLMSLIGRYLQAHTYHTAYNVRDFGESYLADNLSNMPSDLLGRLERDCGVYALTVAYEVYRAARAASPRLNLGFRIFTMLDHVTLVIDDRENNEFYIVNNDQITPPRRGNPMEEIAVQYRPMRNVQEMVTPATEMPIGDTSLTDAQFRNRAWSNYQDAARVMLAIPPGQTREEVYRKYYDDEKRFDEQIPRLRVRLDALVAELAAQPAGQHLAIMNNRMPGLLQGAAPLFGIFLTHGPAPALDLNTERPDPALQARLRGRSRFLMSSPAGVHPLVRLAMALRYWQSLGVALDQLGQTYLSDMDIVATATPTFATQLAGYRGGPVF